MSPKEQLAQFHAEWLQNPVTREYIDILKKRADKVVDAIGVASADENSDGRIRNLGAQLQTLKAVQKITADTAIFVSQVYPEQSNQKQ